jgi:uncharacterized protein YdeI (YjbR/CyaY-like superfamily)
MNPVFFETQAALRKWFEKNHLKEKELLAGFYKVGSGKPSITWPQSVDEALCFGWIDGIRRSLDEKSYSIRFTPRKDRSNWSTVNINKVAELIKNGMMRPAGLAAFEKRTVERPGIYSHEQKNVKPDAWFEKSFKQNKKAWTWFNAQSPSYRKAAIRWVMTAKQEQTREKRLAILMEDSANGLHIKEMRRTPPPKKP